MTVQPKTRVLQASPSAIAEAASCLAAGRLVAFPTETVYGLGADAANGEAIARLYAAKERPEFNPLIVHVADTPAARGLGIFNAAAEKLARAFWPGPLTLVLPRVPGCAVADLATAGLDTVAVRVPDHAIAHAILMALARPVVAPSANRSGRVSPTTAQHVVADLGGRIDLVIDAGATKVGVESTIVACVGEEPVLLRPGGIPRDKIEMAFGAPLGRDKPKPKARDSDAPVAPGQLASHYAPRTKLRLNAAKLRPDEALLAFGPALPPGADQALYTLNLSPGADLVEAAANLFCQLRALDMVGAAAIAVVPVPHEGLGEAINDRLQRAAAPRSK